LGFFAKKMWFKAQKKIKNCFVNYVGHHCPVLENKLQARIEVDADAFHFYEGDSQKIGGNLYAQQCNPLSLG